MFRNILSTNGESVEWLPVTVLLIFFVVFLFILWNTFTTNKKEEERIKNLPLENDYNYLKGDENGRN